MLSCLAQRGCCPWWRAIDETGSHSVSGIGLCLNEPFESLPDCFRPQRREYCVADMAEGTGLVSLAEEPHLRCRQTFGFGLSMFLLLRSSAGSRTRTALSSTGDLLGDLSSVHTDPFFRSHIRPPSSLCSSTSAVDGLSPFEASIVLRKSVRRDAWQSLRPPGGESYDRGLNELGVIEFRVGVATSASSLSETCTATN